MAKLLTKCVYGFETNNKKTPFNFLNEQRRVDSIIDNAGWFNADGERLGSGDLSIKDMEKISKTIPMAEAFFVLTEANSGWDLPKELDRAAPGRDYIIENASWIIGRDLKGGFIYRIKNDFTGSKDINKDGIKYVQLSRDVFFDSLKHQKKKAEAAKVVSKSPAPKIKLITPAKPMPTLTNKPIIGMKPAPIVKKTGLVKRSTP